MENTDAVIALEQIIRGSTTHYDYGKAAEVSKEVQMCPANSDIPVKCGVTRRQNIEAGNRARGTKAGNKGYATVH
ncbi:MAG: 6,7-dimethyl-8-ribityllumazine synthase [Roseburia sp.]